MPIPFAFDFKKPDYIQVMDWRLQNLIRLKKSIETDATEFQLLKQFYKKNPAQFIIDWGCTYDPRNVERDLPTTMPFLLFPKQEEWVYWFLERWQKQESGLVEKSREMGMSWIATALAATLCLFNDGLVIGFGSRKDVYVDNAGDPTSLFHKIRQFISLLPKEFRGNWDLLKHSKLKLITFPDTDSRITGESGDGIGRGGRYSIYLLDESAHIARPELIEASLSEATNCRVDISTPFGMGNPFARKIFANKLPKFTFHWRDDPRKDEAWYQRRVAALDDPVVVAQELDLDYSASLEGIVIPAKWVRAAINAHIKLNIKITGDKKAALDIADEGRDKNALVTCHGILINYLKVWSGKNQDIYSTTEKAFNECDLLNIHTLFYDADGIGAGLRGDARKINEKRKEQNQRMIKVQPFRGSGEVVQPEGYVYPSRSGEINQTDDRRNKDFFGNAKAQAWWALRKRFQLTYRAIEEKSEYNPDEIISISSACDGYERLINELSQPTFTQNSAGKIIVDKKPDGAMSPNAADALMILCAPKNKAAVNWFTPLEDLENV